MLVPCIMRRPTWMQQRRAEITNPNQLHTLGVKKSVAMRTSLWIRINAVQVIVCLRSGLVGCRSVSRCYPPSGR
jgi:hypothetical protein